MNCISVEQLFALTQNDLPAGEAERLRAHLGTGCIACRTQWNRLRKVLMAIASHNLLQVPDWLVQQAMSLFAWHTTKPHESGLKQVPAILLVDSFTGGLLVQFRGIGPVSRQMLYRAGNYDIDLSIDYIERTRAIDIIGQAMPLTADADIIAAADIELLKGSTVAFDTQTNEFGEFILSGIPQGIYDLGITLKDKQLHLVRINATSRLY
ncbi:MAG: hypothetical protein HY314_05630 [Acidobacteria bacterium]|nr:hypothetical protein [Acidobacteriota bacterium]